MDVRSPSPIAPPPLVGRDRELAVLHDRLTATRAGRGSLVLIGGEAGIGKTALADRLARDAADARLSHEYRGDRGRRPAAVAGPTRRLQKGDHRVRDIEATPARARARIHTGC